MSKFLIYFIIIVPFLGSSQQQIKGIFSPASEFKATMLYQLSAGNTSYVSYSSVDENGEIQINLDDSVPAGLYKLVYALPQSDHNFEFIYNGSESVEFIFDAEIGVEFTKSKENQLLHGYTKSIAFVQNELVQLYAKPTMDTLTYRRHAQKMDSLQNSYEAQSKGTIAAHFITANKPYIPIAFETVNTYVSNVKAHYLKAINFQDTILQGSNFIVDKTLEYILRMHVSGTPSIQEYQANIDAVNNAMTSTDLSYQLTTLNTLRESLITSGQEALAVYLTKTYLLPLAIERNATEQMLSLQTFLRVAVGAKAPNFDIQDPLTGLKTSLYDLEAASNYLLVFWSSDCGHCMDELPKVHAYISKHPEKALKIITIGLEKTPQPWNETIKRWPKFTHVIAEGKWEHSIPKNYDIQATPSYFVLDASKKITSKPYLLKDLIAVLDQK